MSSLATSASAAAAAAGNTVVDLIDAVNDLDVNHSDSALIEQIGALERSKRPAPRRRPG